MERVIEVDEPGESLPSELTTSPTNVFSRKRVAALACEQVGFRPRLMRPPTRRRTHREYSHTDIVTSTFEISVNSRLESRQSMEGSDVSSSSAITVVTSATSSSDPWSSSGFVEQEEGEDTDVSWEHDDDSLVAPKLEPIEDEVFMEDVKESTVPTTPIVCSTPVPLKRRRGRPRKHPIPTPETMAKVSKGRSKTGCITCRKRKKKCDEAKPHCMNCEKNAVVCEGYPDKTIWKSGKEKAEEGTTIWTKQQRAEELIASTARLRRVSLPIIRLEPVIHGVETTGDKMFFEHYIFRLSTIFTVEGETKNAFKDMLLPLAVQHLGLMHSILALSSRHIDYRSPYGKRLLEDHPDVDVETLQKRSQFHHDAAMKELHSDIERQDRGDKDNVVISAIFGQMLCLVLQTLADPSPCGEHRVHLQAYKNLIQHSPPEDGPFLEFIQEFFQYHIGLDELISFPQERADLGAADEEWNTPATMVPTDAVRLLGVVDGLFLYMSKITNIRNKIRQNMKHGLDPVVDYTSLYRATEIDAWIRAWRPAWPPGDARDLAGLLYKQMIWVYLWRTIYPPKSTTWRPDPRIIQAVNDGIALLGQFSPRDPSQTLILAPAFVIGCAAFEQGQRDQIRKAIGVVKAYMEYKNSDTALEVLEEVWRLMDVKDEASWDWQSIAHGMGMDFLPT